MRISRKIKEKLFNDPEEIKVYINYANYAKVHPRKFAIFQDFSSYEIVLFLQTMVFLVLLMLLKMILFAILILSKFSMRI